VQVTVQKIWPLDPTKKSGGFKGTDGVNYYCEIGAYHLLAEGATYEANARPYVSKTGKSSFIMPKDWHPPATQTNGHSAPPPTPTQPAPPRPAANGPAPANGFVPEQEKQGYIVVQVVMKILAEAQTQAGSPPNTEDMGLIAQCAVQTWNQHIKGKV
jgi:hypothetical protein